MWRRVTCFRLKIWLWPWDLSMPSQMVSNQENWLSKCFTLLWNPDRNRVLFIWSFSLQLTPQCWLEWIRKYCSSSSWTSSAQTWTQSESCGAKTAFTLKVHTSAWKMQREKQIKQMCCSNQARHSTEKRHKRWRGRGAQLVAARGPSVHHSISSHTHSAPTACHFLSPTAYLSFVCLWHLMLCAATSFLATCVVMPAAWQRLHQRLNAAVLSLPNTASVSICSGKACYTKVVCLGPGHNCPYGCVQVKNGQTEHAGGL